MTQETVQQVKKQIHHRQVLFKQLQENVDKLGDTFQKIRNLDKDGLRQNLHHAGCLPQRFDDYHLQLMREIEHRVMGKAALESSVLREATSVHHQALNRIKGK